MPDHFLLAKEGAVATLTFNRPEKHNPLNALAQGRPVLRPDLLLARD